MKKFFITFLIASSIIAIASIYAIFAPEKDYETTTGIIVRFEEDYDFDTDTHFYTTFINYEVDDKQYEDVEYGAYKSSMKVGDEVIVYYAKDDPTFIQAEGYTTVPYITLVGSIIFFATSLYLIRKN